MEIKSFREKENCCQTLFQQHGPFWHLCTSGQTSALIFKDEPDFVSGINLLAICCHIYNDVHLIAYALMNNHIHLLLEGQHENCLQFFKEYRRRLRRYLSRSGRVLDKKEFECAIHPIDDLNHLRNTLVYISRNGYVINASFTPFSYPWSSGRFIFNNIPEICPNSGNLTIRKMREISHSRNPDIPSSWSLTSAGTIAVKEFCDIAMAESLFRDAHHYFTSLSKNIESQSEIAEFLNEDRFLTDEELFREATRLCHKEFNSTTISSLAFEDKVRLARKLHFDYHASNQQIRRITFLSITILDELFPKT